MLDLLQDSMNDDVEGKPALEHSALVQLEPLLLTHCIHACPPPGVVLLQKQRRLGGTIHMAA